MTREELLDRMAEKMQLAGIYADDGAFHSAARVLHELAEEVRTQAEAWQEARDMELGLGHADR